METVTKFKETVRRKMCRQKRKRQFSARGIWAAWGKRCG